MADLAGKTAIVTGGAGGIGGAISVALAKAGATVTATGYAQSELDGRTGDPNFANIALTVLNVGDAAEVDRFAAGFDRADILINCAGTTVRGPAAFEEEGFTHVIDVNLTGTMRTCRAFQPKLAAQGGAIVNIASMMSYFGSATAPGYAASKGGVSQLTKSLAIAWAASNIRVNAIAPGWIVTPLTEAQIDPALREKVIARTPMGTWGMPQHIADAAIFLCSPQAAFITGAILPVDGGYSVV